MRSKRYKLPNQVDLKPASKKQIDYAATRRISLPKDATVSDASALIHSALDDDTNASESLMSYSAKKNIVCSPYVGNKYLHNLIFDNLIGAEKIAFFCFCIYKAYFEDGNEDLYNHESREIFEEFSKQCEGDISFIMSLEEYYGEELITFGKKEKIAEDGTMHTVYGGSIHTAAYKKAYEYLTNYFEMLPKREMVIAQENRQAQRPVTRLLSEFLSKIFS